MFVVTVLLAVLATASAASVATSTGIPFWWRDCTKDTSTQAIEIVNLHANPVPLVYPGQLKLNIQAVVKKTIYPGTIFQLEFVRHTGLGINVKIPCIGNFGSCALDTCALLNTTLTSTDSAIKNIGSQAQSHFVSVGARIDCPIQPQNITIPDFDINVPDLTQSAVMSALGDGSYNVTILTKDPTSGQELGCVEFNAGLKSAKHHGILFG